MDEWDSLTLLYLLMTMGPHRNRDGYLVTSPEEVRRRNSYDLGPNLPADFVERLVVMGSLIEFKMDCGDQRDSVTYYKLGHPVPSKKLYESRLKERSHV